MCAKRRESATSCRIHVCQGQVGHQQAQPHIEHFGRHQEVLRAGQHSQDVQARSGQGGRVHRIDHHHQRQQQARRRSGQRDLARQQAKRGRHLQLESGRLQGPTLGNSRQQLESS